MWHTSPAVCIKFSFSSTVYSEAAKGPSSFPASLSNSSHGRLLRSRVGATSLPTMVGLFSAHRAAEQHTACQNASAWPQMKVKKAPVSCLNDPRTSVDLHSPCNHTVVFLKPVTCHIFRPCKPSHIFPCTTCTWESSITSMTLHHVGTICRRLHR